MPTRFYFDHNATTPLLPDVLHAVTAALAESFGNASSIHYPGQQAKLVLEQARRQVAELVGAKASEIVFVSSGTEANNLALFGCLNPGDHLITSAIEHPAVLAPCARLQQLGVAVSYVKPDANGCVDPDDIRRAIRPQTRLISVMHANNETGAVQPLREIAGIARQAGVLLHSDGVQTCGRLALDLKDLGVDLYSLSGHKLYAPKGVGALYVREGVTLNPLILGGRHERGRRAGTENVPGAAGFGCAAQWAASNLQKESGRLAGLRDRLERAIQSLAPDVVVNAAGAPRLPNTTNLCFSGISGEALVIALDLRGFAVSSGSACSSGAVEPSHVLLAMGLTPEQARSSVRFSLGYSNTEEQVDALAEAVAEAARRLRHISPTYSHA